MKKEAAQILELCFPEVMKLDILDLELLVKAGVVKKKYNFTCPVCGAVCMTISEHDLRYYLRVWELLKMAPLSDAQMVEFYDLCALGFRYIGVFCPNPKCDGESDKAIMSEEEWNEQLKYAEVSYEIV